jgi:RHS repeat-associated protein
VTFSATCAFGKVTRIPSYYRAEQYDSDLGLYYLRARYYNPYTGRFLSRDPVNGIDPNGRADLKTAVEYAAIVNAVLWTDLGVYSYSKALGKDLICTEIAILVGVGAGGNPWVAGGGAFLCNWLFPAPPPPPNL